MIDEVVCEVLAAGPLVEAEGTLLVDRRSGGTVQQIIALLRVELAAVVASELILVLVELPPGSNHRGSQRHRPLLPVKSPYHRAGRARVDHKRPGEDTFEVRRGSIRLRLSRLAGRAAWGAARQRSQMVVRAVGVGARVSAGCELSRSGSENSHTPSLAGAAEWINSEPLDPAGLLGRAVVVNFWTWTCIKACCGRPARSRGAGRLGPVADAGDLSGLRAGRAVRFTGRRSARAAPRLRATRALTRKRLGPVGRVDRRSRERGHGPGGWEHRLSVSVARRTSCPVPWRAGADSVPRAPGWRRTRPVTRRGRRR